MDLRVFNVDCRVSIIDKEKSNIHPRRLIVFRYSTVGGKKVSFSRRNERCIRNEKGSLSGRGRILRKMSKNNAVIFYAISNAAPQGCSLRVRGENISRLSI